MGTFAMFNIIKNSSELFHMQITIRLYLSSKVAMFGDKLFTGEVFSTANAAPVLLNNN